MQMLVLQLTLCVFLEMTSLEVLQLFFVSKKTQNTREDFFVSRLG